MKNKPTIKREPPPKGEPPPKPKRAEVTVHAYNWRSRAGLKRGKS